MNVISYFDTWIVAPYFVRGSSVLIGWAAGFLTETARALPIVSDPHRKIFRGIQLKGYLHYKFLFCILYCFPICLSNSFLHISSKELSLFREVDGGLCLQDIREAVMYRLRKAY